jgi:hypothetical protein
MKFCVYRVSAYDVVDVVNIDTLDGMMALIKEYDSKIIIHKDECDNNPEEWNSDTQEFEKTLCGLAGPHHRIEIYDYWRE